MTSKDEIRRKLSELEVEREELRSQLERLRQEDEYKAYLLSLVEADIAEPSIDTVAAEFKELVLQWLSPKKSRTHGSTIKGWVLATINAEPKKLSSQELRERFMAEFGRKRVASVRQYLTKTFDLVRRVDGKLVLTPNGKAELKKLEKSPRR